MSAAALPPKTDSQAYPWHRILPCLTVFAAAFLLFGLLWPALSPGVRASVSVDFCLPQNMTELSKHDTNLLKSFLANQVSTQLTGEKFDALIQQTHQTGNVHSAAIEFYDRELIAKNINLGFAIESGSGQLQIDYVCQGNSDQIRFLQLLGQRLANSIENLVLSPEAGVMIGNQVNSEKFDRAIWLANQIQSDLNQIRGGQSGGSNGNQNQAGRSSPYAFASTHSTSQKPAMVEALNSIDANSLSGLLTEIKSETASTETDATLSVLQVDPVKVRAINATPDRWAMVGLLAMAGFVSGFFALYQFTPVKPAANVQALSETLGIPVVAVLPSDQKPKPKFGSVEFYSSLASTLLVFSKLFLIAISVVVIGFVLIDSSIRESFFQNPFDGVAKIFRVFFGYA